MKNNQLILGAVAVIGAAYYFLIYKKSAKGATTSVSSGVNNGFTSQIFVPNDTANGWKYYDDGTAIDGAGNYYKDGKMIWAAGQS